MHEKRGRTKVHERDEWPRAVFQALIPLAMTMSSAQCFEVVEFGLHLGNHYIFPSMGYASII
jgi:hypothetical protein